MGSTLLLEREAAIDEVGALLEAVRGGHGRMAVVQGPAGTGKSTLLEAAQRDAEAAGLRVFYARGSELEREYAFGAIRQLFERHVAEIAPAERDELLSGAAAAAEPLILTNAKATAGAADGFSVLHAIYWLAAGIAAREPLLLIVDDLHWVDASSLRALAFLGGRISDLPIGLVVALRPHEAGPHAALVDAVRDEAGAAAITLAGLSPAAVAALIRASVPGVDDETCRACYDAAGGNPFYTRELLRALGGNGNGGLSADAVRDASVPSVADRVVRRIETIGPGAAALARSMAVLGDGRRLGDAAKLAGLSEADAAAAASRMRRIEVLRSEDPFEFVHPLVLRSVYDSLTVTDRDAAHSAAADLLRGRGASSDEIAAHLTATRPAGSSTVALHLRETAGEARSRGAADAAIALLRRALDEDALEPPRDELLQELGDVELVLRMPVAIEHYEEALANAPDRRRRARIALSLSESLASTGHWERAIALAADGLRELGDSDPELALEFEASQSVYIAYDQHLVEKFDGRRERMTELARGDSWAALALSSVLASISVARGERLDEALELCEQSLRGGRLFAERGAGAWASAQVLMALCLLDVDTRTHEVLDELEVQARRQGSLIALISAEGYRSFMHCRNGDLPAAEEGLRMALDVAVQNQQANIVGSVVYFMREAIVERRSLDDVARLVETYQLEPAFRESVVGALLTETRAHVRLRQNRRLEAIDDLRACEATYRALRFGPVLTPWRTVLAAAIAPDNRDEAQALADEELELARATGMPRVEAVALRGAGIVDGRAEGIEQLRTSAEMLASTTARYEHARSLIELGAALRRGGKRLEARDVLVQGREVAHRCGAEYLTARAGEELLAAGHHPRPITKVGYDALTASERRVARMVAEGRTNPEVAQELFVSLKTVETHLSNAYAKLGLSGHGSRRRLSGALQAATAGREP